MTRFSTITQLSLDSVISVHTFIYSDSRNCLISARLLIAPEYASSYSSWWHITAEVICQQYYSTSMMHINKTYFLTGTKSSQSSFSYSYYSCRSGWFLELLAEIKNKFTSPRDRRKASFGVLSRINGFQVCLSAERCLDLTRFLQIPA